MQFINQVQLYSFSSDKKDKVKNSTLNQENVESLGSKHSPICCFISCTSPISDSKDYKTLTKIFEKLMLRIENIYVVNVKTCKNEDFIFFTNEFQFKKIYIFGENAVLHNIPIPLVINKIAIFDTMKILYLETLTNLTQSTDKKFKDESWGKIQEFHKITE